MAGKLNLGALVSQTYPLSQINQAFDVMLAGDMARGVVIFE
jgi:Zn-dependent alcohol dehydrogenase